MAWGGKASLSLCLFDHLQLLVELCFARVKAFNFVGKLLGPRGNSLKRLQEDTLTKMSILGKGSMRDKEKLVADSLSAAAQHVSLYCSPINIHGVGRTAGPLQSKKTAAAAETRSPHRHVPGANTDTSTRSEPLMWSQQPEDSTQRDRAPPPYSSGGLHRCNF
ncbi:unnamed protein product [Pleuronectes platessa]|uniref:KHDC4/BBP-like KH-domain type I domain-containing protein n=1 Tax=Pleuronectes platessa TaxID=8262 RepID=A0A9N7VTX8_PLEPL|nr:unnamed protein product [Pleuronectes platessa]